MSTLNSALLAAADELDAQADELTRLDALQGDGDLGRTAGLIAGSIRTSIQENGDDVIAVLRGCGAKIASVAPSSSGTLVASAFLAAAKTVASDSHESKVVSGLTGAIEGVQHRGKAQAGDRTMLDALFPARDALVAEPANYEAAAAAAEAGIEATKTMEAKFGRARFLSGNAVGEPDPGAVMVGTAIAAALRSS